MNIAPKLTFRWWLLLPLVTALAAVGWQKTAALRAGAGQQPDGVAASPVAPTSLLLRSPSQRSDEAAAPSPANPTSALPAPAAAEVVVALDVDSQPRSPPPDIFAVRGWEPPQPPQPSLAALPSAPRAPALPFHYIGRISVPSGAVSYMLTDGSRVIVVAVGDSIGSIYRLEKVARDQLHFRYRPMNVLQSLAIGGRL